MARLFDTGIFSVNATDGSVGVGYKLNFYVTGTSTRKNTYPTRADALAGTNANANPVLTDAGGRLPPIWLTGGDYKAVLTTAADVVVGNPKDPADSNPDAATISFDPNGSYDLATVGNVLKYGRAVGWADYAHLAPNGIQAGDDTAVWLELAAAWHAGRAVDLTDYYGAGFDVDPDVGHFIPPTGFNGARRSPPPLFAHAGTEIRARATGTWLMKIGGDTFDQRLYAPVIDLCATLDCRGLVDYSLNLPHYIDATGNWTCDNFRVAGLLSGSLTADSASAGLKGRRHYNRDVSLWQRTASTCALGANPAVAFPVAHALWPSAGRVTVTLGLFGSYPGAWDVIAGRSLDALATSATGLQLLNVDTTAFGAFTGTMVVYLCVSSNRVPIKITNVTNANPGVFTTDGPHLLADGSAGWVSKIGNMMPDATIGKTGIHGLFTINVTGTNTFTVSVSGTPLNTTSTSVYGGYNDDLGPGWVKPWVDWDDCVSAEHHVNAADIDADGCFVTGVTVGFNSDEATSGYNGKYGANHFYNFPEHGELRAGVYAGGRNSFAQGQFDGPFDTCLFLVGAGNVSSNNGTNYGLLDGKDAYGVFATIQAGASLSSTDEQLRGAPSAQMLTDFVGAGKYECDNRSYSFVLSPVREFGGGRRAVEVRFDGAAAGVIKSSFQANSMTRSSTGLYLIDALRPIPPECYFSGSASDASGSGLIVTEDLGYGTTAQRLFTRRIKVVDATNTPADAGRVDGLWRFPDA